VSAKFEFIDAAKANDPVVTMCGWTGVSASGCYEWRDRPVSATERRREQLSVLIQAIFADSDGTLRVPPGPRRVGPPRRAGQPGAHPGADARGGPGGLPAAGRGGQATTPSDAAVATPDLVARDVTAQAPGVKMVGDITYLPTWEGWVYVASVIDCCTKACIGYARGRPYAHRAGDRRPGHGCAELRVG
jgi:transposase InsO family protein